MKKVVVGMSGGVDSSVAAWLLKEQGYDVIGVTMQLWPDGTGHSPGENESCHSLRMADDAGKVAEKLGIPHMVMDFKQEFRMHVMDYFIREYERGRTPNPCIACNRYIKWEALMQRGRALGADCIATGHYARVEKLPNGRYAVCVSAAAKKDQTYALYRLTQEQLSHTLMPAGDYEKEEIRAIAGREGILSADKPDSQDICFIPDGDYASFIEKNTGKKTAPGNFVTTDGTVAGRHKGLIHYTVGQRKGLGLALGIPVFVLEIRPETNEIVVGSMEESLVSSVKADRLNFMAVEEIDGEMRVWAKIRYNHKGARAVAKRTGKDEITCFFDEPQRSPAPGQALVLYDEEKRCVLGGGTII